MDVAKAMLFMNKNGMLRSTDSQARMPSDSSQGKACIGLTGQLGCRHFYACLL